MPAEPARGASAGAPLQHFELAISITPDDLPEDRFNHHVNNARYFAFINRTFHGWYVAMGLRGRLPDFSAVMAHCEYDFLRQVNYPGQVSCRIKVARAGRTSLEHAIEIWDVTGEPVLAGRGRAVHVGVDRASGKPIAWPASVLAQCWSPAD